MKETGWFVGWASRNGKTLVFARLIQDDGALPGRKPAGLRARDAFIADFPAIAELVRTGGE